MTTPRSRPEFGQDTVDDLLGKEGVRLVHWRAMKCPIGLRSRNDQRPEHHDHDNCSNGLLYVKAGELDGIFQGAQLNSNHTDIGMIDAGTAQLTLARYYDEVPGQPLKEVLVSPYDRLYLAEAQFEVVNWEVLEYNPTGVDKPQYPALAVEHLVDARGREYRQSEHFEVVDGRIRWRQGVDRPGIDPDSGAGVPYSVRYRFRPFWYVKTLVHEIRVRRADDFTTGRRNVERLPYTIVVQREVVFENSTANSSNPYGDRETPRPADGSFVTP